MGFPCSTTLAYCKLTTYEAHTFAHTFTRDNAVRLRHVESVRVPLRHVAPSTPQVLDSLHRLAKEQSRRPTDFLSGHALIIKTGSESIEATLRKRRISFAGFVARMEDTRLPKCVMFGELVGGAGGLRGGPGKRVNGVFPGRPLSEFSASTSTGGRLQPRTRGNGAGRQNKGRNVSW